MQLKFLPKIKSPADIRDFSREQLQQLVDELRYYTIETISQIGGPVSYTHIRDHATLRNLLLSDLAEKN